TGSACTSSFSRLARRLLALRPAHSRGHQVVTAIRRLQPFRYLYDCSDCFRRERITGWDLHPLESAAFSRRTPISAIRLGALLLLRATQTADSSAVENHGRGAPDAEGEPARTHIR